MVKLRTNDRVSMRGFSGVKGKKKQKVGWRGGRTGKRGGRDCRLPKSGYAPRLARQNELGERNESNGRGGKKEGGGRRNRRNGKWHAGALSSRDEWNREIRSAFSKMRPKYRVSGCAPRSSLFAFRRRGGRAYIFALFTWTMRNAREMTIPLLVLSRERICGTVTALRVWKTIGGSVISARRVADRDRDCDSCRVAMTALSSRGRDVRPSSRTTSATFLTNEAIDSRRRERGELLS